MRFPLRALPLLIFVFVGTVLLISLLSPAHRTSPLVGQPFPSIALPLLSDSSKQLTSDDWKGQAAIINVFASWCQPCRAEHASLMRLRHGQHIALYGIAWRDTPEQIQTYLEEHGNPFTATGIDSARATTVPLGLYGVPTTYLVDADGIIRWKWDAPLDEDTVQHTLLPLLVTLEKPHAK